MCNTELVKWNTSDLTELLFIMKGLLTMWERKKKNIKQKKWPCPGESSVFTCSIFETGSLCSQEK